MGYLTTTNDKDFVFRRGGKQLTLTLTKDGSVMQPILTVDCG